MSKEILQDIIKDFDSEKFIRFFREKNRAFAPRTEDLSQYDDDNFSNGIKLGEIEFTQDETMLICAFRVEQSLSERSGKKAQYEKGKKILKYTNADAGIFIFYDGKGNFRFSLIYPEYTGTKRQWSYFKRFTYFVSPELTNKTFLQQIGDGDFSALQKIKEAFSVDPVTKQFYGELQSWYFWAIDKIKFPDDYKHSNDPQKDKEIRNATNLIRLITRTIFIWFLAEKGLVQAELFSKENLKEIVKDFMQDKEASNFYNAILQNLFFGTLNQKMDERKFADERGYPANKKEYGVKNLYRYADKFPISKNKVLSLFKDIPFLNGGLFDCLDKEDETGKVIYVDGFSRNPKKQAIIPDYLFFQEKEEKVDLSQYGLGSNKTVRGLIEILNSYNFTIDENTPVDQEIALDPELLGKVFENLLASYNPETATTARKATGSYYTPREIVDYMVEESLIAYLKNTINDPARLRQLLSYSEDTPEFSDDERQKLISAIDNIKILDPACGSGAFPMGILHKLVHALQKIDPENKYWHELQYQKALKESEEVFKQGDKNQRQEMLKEINEAFDEGINYPDYARKLYLIENCIYGVDIQPIAIQISKLRFFISLVLDQKVDRSKENLGIRALPNLETKFVAANTLIQLEIPRHIFYTDKIRKLEDEIKSLRHRYFLAKTRTQKLRYQEKDKKLRGLLADELKSIGFPSDSSEKIATFDLYDQNTFANWFDPEWMFGITDGFDIVIGNPPYIQLQKDGGRLAEEFKNKGYQTYNRMGDIYALFYEKGISLLKQKGILALITSNKWMRAGYGESLRNFFTKYNPLVLIDLGPDVFESATVDTNILIIQKSDNAHNLRAVTISNNKKENIDFTSILQNKGATLKKLTKNAWTISSNIESRIKEKIEVKGIPLKDWDVKIYRGVLTGFNEAFIIDGKKKDELISQDPKSAEIIKPILRGKDIKRYKADFADLWLIATFPALKLNIDDYPAVRDYLKSFGKKLHQTGETYTDENGQKVKTRKKTGNNWFETQDQIAYYEEFEKEKIVYSEIVREPQFHYDKHKFYPEATTFLMTGKHIKFLIALLNSIFITFAFKKFYAGGGLGESGYRYKKAFLENLPIPKITQKAQQPFIELVDIILRKKEQNQDTTAEERQIDEMVYEIYGLTEDEIAIVEGRSKG